MSMISSVMHSTYKTAANVVDHGVKTVGGGMLLLDAAFNGTYLALGLTSFYWCNRLKTKQPITAIHLGVCGFFFTFLTAYRFMTTWQDLYASSFKLNTRVHCTKVTAGCSNVQILACNAHQCQTRQTIEFAGECSQLPPTILPPSERITSTQYFHCHELGCESVPNRIELVSDAEPK